MKTSPWFPPAEIWPGEGDSPSNIPWGWSCNGGCQSCQRCPLGHCHPAVAMPYLRLTAHGTARWAPQRMCHPPLLRLNASATAPSLLTSERPQEVNAMPLFTARPRASALRASTALSCNFPLPRPGTSFLFAVISVISPASDSSGSCCSGALASSGLRLQPCESQPVHQHRWPPAKPPLSVFPLKTEITLQ